MNPVDEAVEVLRNGGVAAIPTDTVYGLAAHGLDAAAVGRVFEVKGRPVGMALPLLLADTRDLPLCCVDVPDSALSLAAAFWPGSLTLVLRRSDAVPDIVAAGGATVAVRVPDHPVPREIARHLGSPITGTSANLSGAPARDHRRGSEGAVRRPRRIRAGRRGFTIWSAFDGPGSHRGPRLS